MKAWLEKIWAFFHRPAVESFIHTLITDLIYDAAVGQAFMNIFVSKDFSETAVYAFGYAVFRTILRVCREFLKKKFPRPGTE